MAEKPLKIFHNLADDMNPEEFSLGLGGKYQENGFESGEQKIPLEFISSVGDIIEKYKTRLNRLDSIFSQSQGTQIMPCQFDSFALYLKSYSKSERLLRWYVLDTCLLDSPGLKYQIGLRALQEDAQAWSNLQTLLGTDYTLGELELTKEEEKALDSTLSSYMEQLTAAEYCLYMLKKPSANNGKRLFMELKSCDNL